jgi:erythronate-4-phosphate dehydrogenase
MAMSLRIVADENIPCAEAAFGALGDVCTVKGRSIDAAAVADADVLLVRSVTPVGPALLADSPVQFVGSATIGTDHVDTDYLQEAGIAFAHAPGANADSVADYVVAALLHLAVRTQAPLSRMTVGIVGCGNIGGRLARRLPALGVEVLKNDPPRAEAAEAAGRTHDFMPLPAVLAQADVVTFHVPLTREGAHPTYHLADDEALAQLAEGTWLLNTSRGAVVDPYALRRAVEGGRLGALVLDVWANEPTPDPDLLDAADIATPHIAGYAYDGKVRGTAMLHAALTDHLGVDPAWTMDAALRPLPTAPLRCVPPDPALPAPDALHRIARQGYDIMADDRRLRGLLDRPREEHGDYFSRLRKTYPRRRELSRHTLPESTVPPALRTAVREGLTMQLL